MLAVQRLIIEKDYKITIKDISMMRQDHNELKIKTLFSFFSFLIDAHFL